MPRVVPSQVVELIDQLFPDARSIQKARIANGPELAAVLSLARQIPPELLTITEQDFADFAVSLQFMESTQQWSLSLQRGCQVDEYRGYRTILILRAALAKCPDEAPSPGTAELTFIPDVALRDSIRRDISAANED